MKIRTTPVWLEYQGDFVLYNLGSGTLSFGTTTACSDGTVAVAAKLGRRKGVWVKSDSTSHVEVDPDLDVEWGEMVKEGDLFVNVKDHGVLGDGTTDDTSAINSVISTQSALASSTKRIRIYFPDGVYLTDGILVKSNLHLDFGNAYIKKRSNGSSIPTNSLVRAVETLTGDTYYGTYSNIKITGGTFDSNGFTCPANIVRLLYVEGLEITGTTVMHSSAAATWAYMLGGHDIRVTDCNVRNGTARFQDGIHVCHGENVVITGGVIESGDDAIALGSEPTDVYFAADPESLRYVTVTGVVAHSVKSAAIKVYVQTDAPANADWEVSDVVVQGVTGGAADSYPIAIRDYNDRSVGTGRVKRIKVKDFSLYIGTTATASSAFAGQPYGVQIQSADYVQVDGQIEFRTDDSAAAGWRLVRASKALRPEITVRCSELPEAGGIHLSDCSRARIAGCDVIASAETNASLVVLASCPNTELIHNNMTNQLSSLHVVEVTTGTTTTLRIYGGRYGHAAGASAGNGLIASAASALPAVEVKDVDFSEAFDPLSSNIESTAYYNIFGCRGI